jgi:processive 1,2-diacylglycerol beta-glucosyltransferase
MPSMVMKPPKVLILTVSHGASHRRVASALRQSFVALRPEFAVEIVDGLAHCTRWFRAYYDFYLIPLRYWPALWGWIESSQHEASASGPVGLYRRGGQPLFRWLQANNPDIIIATEVGMCEMAALFKRQAGADFWLVGAPTDVDPDLAWAQPEVDLFIAMPDEGVTALTAAGVPASNIISCGVPVDLAFASLPDRETARRRLNVLRDVPLLLVLFGGVGFGRAWRIIPELLKVREPHQVVCIAGRNPRLEGQLRSRCAGDPRFQVLGWVDNMHEWMAAADLLLSKPGASTFIEALCSGLPLLAFEPLPGNERRACDLIEKWQVGTWVRRRGDLAPTVAHLLSHPDELEMLRRNAISKARPRAACDAALAILNRWEDAS